MEKLTKKWLTKHFTLDCDEWYLSAQGSEYRPLKIRVLESSEYKGGWYISLWDETEEIVIYDGVDYTIERMRTLYTALSGNVLNETKKL